MKTNLIKQTFYELRTQKVASTVTIVGTAMAIFLIMMVMMIDRSATAPFAPESNRSRTLHGMYLHTMSIDGRGINNSGSMNIKSARRIYEGLEGVECVSYYTLWNERIDAEQPGHAPVVIYRKYVDDNFWKVFDHTFLAGKPFEPSTIDGNDKVVILSEDAVRDIMGVSPAEAIGQTVKVGQEARRVSGVIASASPLASIAFSQAFVPSSAKTDSWGSYHGEFAAAILMKPETDEEDVRAQVRQRFDEYSLEMKAAGDSAVYHGQPFTQEVVKNAGQWGSNSTPDVTEGRRKKAVIILLLMLVPAVNMSAMTQSRLKRRVAEMAIKRAYGATKQRLLAEILVENLLLTIIGGLIGLVLSLVGALILGDVVFSGSEFTGVDINMNLDIIFSWSLFGVALAACFILNLLAAGVPAWRASHASPADALRG